MYSVMLECTHIIDIISLSALSGMSCIQFPVYCTANSFSGLARLPRRCRARRHPLHDGLRLRDVLRAKGADRRALLGLRAAAAAEGRHAAGQGAGQHARQRPHQALPPPTSECSAVQKNLAKGCVNAALNHAF